MSRLPSNPDIDIILLKNVVFNLCGFSGETSFLKDFMYNK